MLAGRSYAIRELEELTGFDRRTIVYYIQQDLLPRAGRRGPNTRYPYECLLRLRFIRAMKDLQDQGQTGTITLRDIRRLITGLPAATLQSLLERGPPAAEIEPLLASQPEEASAPVADIAPAPAVPAPSAPDPAPVPAAATAPAAPSPSVGDRRSYGLADANIRKRFPTPGQPAAPALPAGPPADALPAEGSQARLAPLTLAPSAVPGSLGELLRELEIRPAMAGRRLTPGASEHWTEIPITSRVFLSVRGLSADDAPLADSVARELKKLLRTR